MADSQENRTKGTQDSRTIKIEVPGNVFEAMYRIMGGRGVSETAPSGCCDMPRNVCCPECEDTNEQDFTFVLKRKE